MFTGIIQSVGSISDIEPRDEDIQLTIKTGILDMVDVNLGDSIAVNGVCLTVIAFGTDWFQVHVSKETLSCTAGLDQTIPVNLEKALRFSDRLGGHLVSGHVDGLGKIIEFSPVGDCIKLTVAPPHELLRFIATKGSVCVQGVSLTVNHVDDETFTINLIPHTLQCTTFQYCQVGDSVNLEVDLIARYVERIQSWDQPSSNNES